MEKNQKSNNTKAEFKIWMGKDGIMRVIVIGAVDEKDVKELFKEVLKIFDSASGKVDAIGFMDKAGKASTAARETIIKLFKHKKAGKAALVGAPPLIKVMTDVILRIARMKNIKHFKTEEEAVKWIKEK